MINIRGRWGADRSRKGHGHPLISLSLDKFFVRVANTAHVTRPVVTQESITPDKIKATMPVL
jgi:uncharacterized protein (DUF2267 family)